MFRKDEKGAATLIEYTIVLPIVLAIVMLLLFVGFTMHQKAVMEAATERAAIYISRTITDPSYQNIVSTDGSSDSNDISSATITQESIVNAPYRYLFAGSGQITDSELSVADLIKKNQIFIDTDPDVSVRKDAGIFTKVTVTATQEFAIPNILPGLDLPPFMTIETESVVYVNEPAEFIRNADFVIDAVTDIAEKTGIVDKINTVISKVTFFKSKVK